MRLFFCATHNNMFFFQFLSAFRQWDSTSGDANNNQLLSVEFERGRSAHVGIELYVQFYLYAEFGLAIRQGVLYSE